MSGLIGGSFGYGLSLVEKKDNNKAIGMCGIINRDNLDNPDIGFALLPEYHGYNFAYEIANATMIYAKKELIISSSRCLRQTMIRRINRQQRSSCSQEVAYGQD